MAATDPSVSKTDTTLTITRTFDVPPERVFDAWLDAGRVATWMGPRGVRAEVVTLEPRVGGRYRILMHTPDGSNPTVSGIYREIVRPARLVFTWAWAHESGHETVVSLTFRQAGKGTEMTLVHENFPNAQRRDSHSQGWSGSFDKLAEVLVPKSQV